MMLIPGHDADDAAQKALTSQGQSPGISCSGLPVAHSEQIQNIVLKEIASYFSSSKLTKQAAASAFDESQVP